MHPMMHPLLNWGKRRSELKPSTFEKNAERMGYPELRRQHLFIGTGVIEAGRQNRDRSRPKQSGLFRTVRGPNQFWLSAAANSFSL